MSEEQTITIPRAIQAAAVTAARAGMSASWDTALAYGQAVLDLAESAEVTPKQAGNALADRVNVDGYSGSYGQKASNAVLAVDAFGTFAETKRDGTPRFSVTAVADAKAFVTSKDDDERERFMADVQQLGANGSLAALVKTYRDERKANRPKPVSVDDKLPAESKAPETEQLKTDAQRKASAQRLIAQAVELVGIDDVVSMLAAMDAESKVAA